jgi:hypothetical protein
MKLLIVRRTLISLLGIVILAVFLASIGYAFNPIIGTFRSSLQYQKVEREVLKKYTALQDKFEFMLPSSWATMEQPFKGGEIIYNLFFTSDDKKVRGLVQVWDMKKPLKQFLEESKKSAVGAVDFKYYRVKELKTDSNQGYLVDYSRRNNQDKYVRSYEAFIENSKGRVYRISFYVNEDDWKQQYLILFNRIIRSMEIKK